MKHLFLIFAASACATLNAQNVSDFTGAFSYDKPLMVVPSNRGDAIMINASYQAGIKMEQSASEVGLGWDVNTENAIYRTVSGYPDDTKTFNSKVLPTGDPVVNAFGALYLNPNPSPGGGYDVTSIRRGLDTMPFVYPDFDTYQVGGSLLAGQIKPSYYKFYSYNFDGTKYVPNQTGSYLTTVYRKPQFHFSGEFADTLVSRHYSVTPINSSTPFRTPIDAFTGSGYTNSSEPFIGKHLSGATVSNENFDAPSGRLATSTLIEYFTNKEIDTDYSNSGADLNNQNVFIDYKASHARSAASFPEDGIGYFRITASNGLTYHYSLPVYEIGNTTYNVPLNNDYSLVAGLSTTDLPDNVTQEYLQHPKNVNVFVKAKTVNKTAIKWLLVAVTGVDFVDKNGDNMANAGDDGYWISYEYQQWSNNFVQRSPHYGYDYQYIPDDLTQKFPVYFPLDNTTYPGMPYKVSGLFGSVQIRKSEIYHLSRLRTPSHSAIFVRDIRNDERSSDSSVTIGSTFKPAPDLLLKRIVLFKNEQIDSLLALHPQISFNTANYTNFSFSAISNTGQFFTEPWFSQNYNTVKPFILKDVSFSQDYSLCRNYHNSINANYVGSSVLTSPGDVETNISVSSYNTSGKLTLNGIYTYDYKDGKVTPSTQFGYDATNTPVFSNPDYNPRKTDYWGYYKHDATADGYSRYTSVYSRNFTKSWSLLKITDPLGGTTEMEYESNSYQKVIDNEAAGGVRGAAFIYRIKMANTISATAFDLSLEEGNGTTNLLTEFPDLVPGTIAGLKARVCMPYFESTCYNTGYCVDYSGFTSHVKGFAFGDCTFALQPPVAGTPYHITGSIAVPASNIRDAHTFYDNLLFTGTLNHSGATNNYSTSPLDGYSYSGNGFLMCETPIGYDAYGSGIRLKRLKVSNSSNEVYTREYTYEGGVATGEMDRFDYQVLKAGYVGSVLRYDFLQPKSSTLFDMSPYVGYSKVTIQDLGRISAANGKSETTFITDPSYKSNAFQQNYSIHTEATNNIYTAQLNMINECVVKFPNIFGMPLESKIFDKNGNMISRNTMEYEETMQGALVENFHFQDLAFRSAYALQTVNILRNIPVVLKRTTSYGMGAGSVVETLARDELTGEGVTISSNGQNNSTSLSFRTPAYKYYQANEGLNFTQPAFRKILPLVNNMYSYATVDSSIVTPQLNGYSASFSKASYKLYSKTVRQRQYNSGTGKFTTAQVTLPGYINNRSFIFDAGESALNAYGLLDKSTLYSNPLNLSTINNSMFWEPTSTYNWKLVYEYTLFDNYKHLVETRDANNRFQAIRFGYNGYHASAQASNCNYASFTFADFETPAPNSGNATMDGDMLVNNHTLVHASTTVPHTGVRSIQVTSTPVTFVAASDTTPGGLEIGLQSGRIYRASVWVYSTNLNKARLVATINGMVNVATPYAYSNVITADPTTSDLVTTIGSWSLLQKDFVVPARFFTGSSTPLKIDLKSTDGSPVNFDDFVFHPVESNFSANVYDPRTGRITATIDGNGLATGNVYDAAGTVLEVWKDVPGLGYKQIKKETYNYARGANN